MPRRLIPDYELLSVNLVGATASGQCPEQVNAFSIGDIGAGRSFSVLSHKEPQNMATFREDDVTSRLLPEGVRSRTGLNFFPHLARDLPRADNRTPHVLR